MNILLVHNFYQQAGGEDQVFADEGKLLESLGHTVDRYTVHNDQVDSMSRLQLARSTIWNAASAKAIRERASAMSADVVHFHNTFPLISPAAYSGAHQAGAAVVQTLHNYRLICPAATLFRDGQVCEKCISQFVPWPAVRHSCYRGNRSATAAVAAMLTVNRAWGTYRDEVDQYIALTDFSRDKFVSAGLPAELITVKPNFVSPDPGVQTDPEHYAVFVGRLTEEKGIRFLLFAWKTIAKGLPLKILGDGPLRAEVEGAALPGSGIEYLGRRQLDEVLSILGRAKALIFPSLWYEGLPRTIVESFAKGTPVIASRLGSMAELVDHGVNGLLFEPGNEADLARQVAAFLSRGGDLRLAARRTFEARYTGAEGYRALMAVYESAIHKARQRPQTRDAWRNRARFADHATAGAAKTASGPAGAPAGSSEAA